MKKNYMDGFSFKLLTPNWLFFAENEGLAVYIECKRNAQSFKTGNKLF